MVRSFRIHVRWLVLTIFLSPGLVSAAEELNLKEGFWETYVTIRVHGSVLPVPVIKSSKCITRGDPLPNSSDKAGLSCRIFDKTIVGNDVSWKIECADNKGKMDGLGKITYAGDKFEGGMDVEVSETGGGRHMKMEYVMHGERVRACDAEQK